MTDDVKKPLSVEELAKIAADTTNAVRADALREGTLLPIWRNGRVVYVHPDTGKGTALDDDLRVLLAELGAKTGAGRGS